jgi:hypothetical protein
VSLETKPCKAYLFPSQLLKSYYFTCIRSYTLVGIVYDVHFWGSMVPQYICVHSRVVLGMAGRGGMSAICDQD